MILLKRNRVSEKKLIFTDPEGRLVVVDLTFSYSKVLTFSYSKVIRLVAIYAPNKNRQSEYYRNLERFLGTTHLIVLPGDYNTICDAHVDYVGSYSDMKGNSCFLDLISCLQLADP